MYLTTKIHQTDKHNEVDLNILRCLCYHAARLYNVGLYSVRQHFFNTQKYLSYNSNYKECCDNEHYHILLSDCSQQILRLVDRDFQSFFKLLILKRSGKYSEKVRIPRYKNKEALMVCPIQGRSARMQKNGTITIGLTKEFRELYNVNQKKITLTIPKNIINVEKFKEIRIIPEFNGKQFSIEFIYESKNQYTKASGNGYMSIDPGVSNLASCTIFSNGRFQQFIIDGKRLKNINYYYNKMVAKLKSEYDRSKIDNHITKRMQRLINGRNNRIDDYMNNAVKYIIDMCIESGVTTLVIGYNKEQKKDIGIGHKNNQNMCYIPHNKFRNKLAYKCELHGITYCPQEESYTSKASAIDDDFIPDYGDSHIPEFSGNRVKRGLYQASNGSLINADINGSVNILKKHFKERKSNVVFTTDDVRVLVNAPCPRINPWLKATTPLV